MKQPQICWHCIRAAFHKIHLVDKCLIVFMAVLLAQSTYSLFFHSGVQMETGDIDVIVRTSTASIFGYFLSANFIRHAAPSEPVQLPKAPPPDKVDPKPPELPARVATASQLQIIAATGVGLFCLMALLLVRNLSFGSTNLVASPSTAATVTQFRDFVSGCVGFLIGCPTNSTK